MVCHNGYKSTEKNVTTNIPNAHSIKEYVHGNEGTIKIHYPTKSI